MDLVQLTETLTVDLDRLVTAEWRDRDGPEAEDEDALVLSFEGGVMKKLVGADARSMRPVIALLVEQSSRNRNPYQVESSGEEAEPYNVRGPDGKLFARCARGIDAHLIARRMTDDYRTADAIRLRLDLRTIR